MRDDALHLHFIRRKEVRGFRISEDDALSTPTPDAGARNWFSAARGLRKAKSSWRCADTPLTTGDPHVSRMSA
jgi:hypothetical protein